MALVACKECGNRISDKAAACPHCGHPLSESPAPVRQKKSAEKSGCGTLVLILLALFVVAAVWDAMTDKPSSVRAPARQAAPAENDEAKRARLAAEMRDESRTPGSRVMAASQLEMLFPASEEGKEAKEALPALREAHRLDRLGRQWVYTRDEDPMTGKSTLKAVVISSNTHSFDFPYSGPQHARLMIRRHPQYGNDVIFSIERGQLMCPSYDGCGVKVRFGDAPPRTYNAKGPADSSTETVFLVGYDGFLRRMRAVDKVRIQANIYQQGAPAWEFDVSGFDPARIE